MIELRKTQNLLAEKFEGKDIKLISRSPRRKELLAILDIPFRQIDFLIDESSENILLTELAGHLAKEKATNYAKTFPLKRQDLIITADTIVVLGNKLFGKPCDTEEAKSFLQFLSGKEHQVITGVALMSKEKTVIFQEITKVVFKELSTTEINFYVDKYQPLDKAGAYGIQEWIGAVGVKKIEGSYYNVMGLPIHRLYTEMMQF